MRAESPAEVYKHSSSTILVHVGGAGCTGVVKCHGMTLEWCCRADQQLQPCSSSLWEGCTCHALSLCFDLPGARGY